MTERKCTLPGSARNCAHEKTKAGHCSEARCPNYWGSCDLHARGGTRGN